LADRVGDGVEDRHVEVAAAAPAGADAADQARPHQLHLLGVERPLPPGDALDDDRRGSVEQDRHQRVSSTIFRAASQPLAPGAMPFSSRMARPSSSLVPESRTTSGSFMPRWSRAVTRPRATSSPRVMPPNTLISTPRTFGFER